MYRNKQYVTDAMIDFIHRWYFSDTAAQPPDHGFWNRFSALKLPYKVKIYIRRHNGNVWFPQLWCLRDGKLFNLMASYVGNMQLVSYVYYVYGYTCSLSIALSVLGSKQ